MTQHPSSKAAQQITSETELSRRRETIQEWCIFFFGIPTDPLLTYKGRRLDKTPFGWSCASSLGVAYSAMPKEACSLSRPIFVGPSVSQSHSTCFSRGVEKKHESACSSHLGSHTALMAAAQLQVGSPCRRTLCTRLPMYTNVKSATPKTPRRKVNSQVQCNALHRKCVPRILAQKTSPY